ncbi:MAG: hypothetical protein BGO69_17485 [Bacteroidetes bacterium 46-16]|jgi:hypothetical protein|nr:MAG: hypothetical protein BGO69_17485 [Bacteroidetes bacterium 46-16]
MPPSLSERLTAQFYDWELRGRGWLAYELAVDLEPPFHPFFGHSVPSIPVADDGKRPTILGRIVNAILPKEPPPAQEAEPEPIQPYLFECDERIQVFSLVVPKGYKVGIEETEQLLLMLSNCQYPLSFEIIGGHTSISLQFVCRTSDVAYLQSQVKAFFPGCIIAEMPDHIDHILQTGTVGYIQDYGMRDEFMRPLAMTDSLKIDPFTGLFAALENLRENEYAVIQVLFKGTLNPWAESIMRSVLDSDGKSFFYNAPEMVQLAKEKIASPLHAVVLRTFVSSKTERETFTLSRAVESALVRVFTNSYNSLIPLQPAGSDFQENIDNFLLRESQRLGMLLNSKELATIVHLPSESVLTAKLERDARKTKAAPAITEGHTLVLGINSHAGKEKPVTVSNTQRLKHTHIIGATGTGKSTFLQNIICQDIQNGEGICVLDPHGDLIESILPYIQEHRFKDVLIIDPADGEYPVGFNILNAHSEIEKDILSSDLVAVFKRLSTSWGDQMNSVFANAILAFLESRQGGTLVDLRRFLVEKGFRDSYLKGVSDPSIVYYWQKEYPLLKSGSIGPILTRLDTFLRPKLIRNMVAQKKGLDFEHILDSRKIVLVKLSQGLIGTENSYLLGTLFITKFYQAAMARQAKGKEERRDYFLYVDEFQNFITPSMSAILSGARKYHFGLILAHQDMQQLSKYDTELASAVAANAGTRICFRLGDTDAKRFESGFSFFTREDLENLNTGEAIGRIERPDYDFSLTTVPLPSIDTVLGAATTQAVIEQSRLQYGTPKEEVEALFESLREDLITEISNQQAIPKPPVKEKKLVSPQPIPDPVQIAPSVSIEEEAKKKEETQHRYLQNLIKKMAESRGYVVKLEAPTPDGTGRVDVSLERNNSRIACEVSVTTDTDWEIHNLAKCLNAGYELVVCCSSDKKIIGNIHKAAETTFTPSEQAKLLFFEPEQLFLYLDEQLAKEAITETRIKGYRVKVEYNPTTESEMKGKKDTINKTVLGSLRKKKK